MQSEIKEPDKQLSSKRFHQDGTLPEHGEVFVFGSNLAGRHGRGAALVAKQRFGAAVGIGEGYMGGGGSHCYAIPTKNHQLGVLELESIANSVRNFIDFACARTDLQFFVTRIGCVLAGYSDREIAPMFVDAPNHCSLPLNWREFIFNSNRAKFKFPLY